MPAPVFMKEGMFTLVLQRSQKVTEKMTEKMSEKSRVKSRVKSRDKILLLIKKEPYVTIPILAQDIGITVKAIEKQISILKQEGLIEREGPDKDGNWKIIKKETLS